MPAFRKSKILITICLLGIISIINWVNQIKIHRQISEEVSVKKAVNKIFQRTEKEKKDDAQVGMAWKTILPLFLWDL